MTGVLQFNSFGRWEIVDPLGNRAQITSGDVIEVWTEDSWTRTRIESGPEGYYSVMGFRLYNGLPARLTPKSGYGPA